MNLSKWILSVRALAVACLLTTLCGAAQTPFKIGQPAPELKVGRWLKGGPVDSLKPGQIYVLEFWATWCGPCIAAMPHLSELAHKHAGQVTIIGVNILEHGSGEAQEKKVAAFVAKKGKDLDYNVCRDTPDDYLRKHWFEPTRFPGIPTTVVVDGAGKIAWIGHPKDLDQVLANLTAGTFDYVKSAADYAKATNNNEAMGKIVRAYSDAMQAKDWAKAIAIIDDNPQYATSTWFMRFSALLHLDPTQALGQVQAAVAKNDPSTVSLFMAIANTDDLPREVYVYANDIVGRAPQGTDYGTLAKLAWHLGDSAKAVEYQLKFMEFINSRPTKPTAETLEHLEDDLRKFKGKP